MSRVGFFRAAGVVAAKDLRLEWRTWETLSSTLIFSLTVLVVFQFAFGLGTVLLIMRIGRRTVGERAGLVAGAGSVISCTLNPERRDRRTGKVLSGL